MLRTAGDPLVGTALVAGALLLALGLSARRKTGGPRLDEAVTTHLKGAAALTVIFCHVGYFLVDDHRFLFPLSAAGGVAVDLFLMLSGFGLTVAAMKRTTTPWAFYRRRVTKLFGPLWLSLVAVLALDHWRLGLDWPRLDTTLAFVGVIRRADIFADLNSPLWYVTLSLFFYAVFPWAFNRRHAMRSVALLGALSYAWGAWAAPRLLPDVAGLHGLHLFAFPCGVLLAVLASHEGVKRVWQRTGIARLRRGRRAVAAAVLMATVGYLVVHSGVGQGQNIEEAISLLTTLLVVATAVMVPWKFGLLATFGMASYEIYLLHWPLLARHGLFLTALPSWAAMLTALSLLWVAGQVMHWLVARLSPPVGRGRDLVS
jgi:peptidoglycan/LPS O-acetylase OafA/YrhL